MADVSIPLSNSSAVAQGEMYFPSVEAFAAHLAKVARHLDAAQVKGIRKGAQIIQREAKSAIGTYKYGWPPLKGATIARKRRGDTPLLETGELRESIKVRVNGPASGEVYSDSPKAEWHEFGTSRGIPPRPFLGTAADMKGEEAARTMAEPVVEVLAGKV